MGASAVAAVLAVVAVAAGPAVVDPAAGTGVSASVGVAAGCGWRQAASELHDSLVRTTDVAGARLRESLAAAGAGTPGFLDSCTTGNDARGRQRADGCERPYFPRADWLWDPIPAGAALDPESSAMAAELASGDHILNTGEFGVTLIDADEVTTSTPRSAVSLSADWGPDPLAGLRVPVPSTLRIPPGSDGHVAIADGATDTVVNLWVARRSGAGLAANWGAATALGGDGREHNGSSTGAGIARYASVVRAEEIADGHIPHALFFSTNVVKPKEVRYPATKTDGSNMDGAGSPIPEGARVQLDPSIDVEAIPGISKGEATIAKALQEYGAYVGDNGGARMAFIAEYAPDSDAYQKAGLSGDFVALGAIPWDRLRVLSDWSGGTTPTPGDDAVPPRRGATTSGAGCAR
ncbi:hypothetical protein [Pseudonocardia sp. N23]|uniref:hypothetical protein n=1 Tax=Pseudonocardia sp. N23 TaxID=1987376 RepID=UPI000C0333C9|nr:hypothetical protein [Pseudonocardia sp. N23]GAY13167.1 hypothetical protein TOK_2086 [Pseudonocardia sp. N23]